MCSRPTPADSPEAIPASSFVLFLVGAFGVGPDAQDVPSFNGPIVALGRLLLCPSN
jgi:hypothetical protein